MALAYVSIDDIVSAFEEIIRSDFYEANQDILNDLRNYFVPTWIGKLRHNQKKREKPLFEYKLWNYYLAIFNDLDSVSGFGTVNTVVINPE